MLKPHSIATPVPRRTALRRIATSHRRVLQRIVAVIAAGAAILWWPRVHAGYGVAFWMWVCGVTGYALSFRSAERPAARPRLIVCVALVAILGLAAWLRLTALEDIPANISIDEILPTAEAQHIAQGAPLNVFSSTGWFDMPSVTFAFPALVIKAGGDAFYLARLSSALIGLAGIVCIFLLARRLFGEGTGLIASFLLAVAFWHLHNSRTAFPFVQSSFCTALVMYLLVRAQQDRSRATFAVAGVALGLALECYFPVRILLLVGPLFFIADGLRQRLPLRVMVADGAALAGGALLVLGPLLVSVPWHVLAGHSQAVLITHAETLQQLAASYHVSGFYAVFGRNLQESTAMFTQWADVCVLNRSPAGLLDAGTLSALLLGIVLALLQGDLAALLLVLWAALTFILGVALGDWPRASYRLAAAMPALFILAAYGIDRGMLFSTPPWRWYRFTIRPAVLALLGAWILMQNYRLFFVAYAHGDGRDNADSRVRRLLSAQCDGREHYFVGDWRGMRSPSEPGSLDVFCPQHQPLKPGQLPSITPPLRPATFLVAPMEVRAADTLRRCYPGAHVTQHHSEDGRWLFTSIDVTVEQLMIGRSCGVSDTPATEPPS